MKYQPLSLLALPRARKLGRRFLRFDKSRPMQDRLEDTLAKLVAIRSESADTAACKQIIEFAIEELHPTGLHIESDINAAHPWMVGTTRKTKHPKALLVAHLDVVPGSFRQFELTADGNKLYGRGAWDMKFAAACFIEFFKEHHRQLSQLDAGVMFTTDEEIGGYAGAGTLLENGWSADVAIIPDAAAGWQLEEMAKGIRVHKLTARGKTGHSSRPWEGENALETLLVALGELHAAYPLEEPTGPTLSINILESGSAYTQIPETAYAIFDFRYLERADLDGYMAFLKNLSQKYALELREESNGDPVRLQKDNPYVQLFTELLAETTGKPAEYRLAFGASDARWFSKHDIPCIIAGIDGEQFHGPEEYIVRSDLPKFYNMLGAYIFKSAGEQA